MVYVGRVGTGFGARTVAQILPRLKKQRSDVNPFKGANAPKKEPGVYWVRPVLVAEIEFAGWTEDGMVRQGSFKGLREDKPASEVRAELPPDAKSTPLADAGACAIPPNLRALESRLGLHFVMGLAISNPDKAMWPAVGKQGPVSKLDLAQYFEAVGSWMIEHVRARPVSLVRAPDGIGGEQFFQTTCDAGHVESAQHHTSFG